MSRCCLSYIPPWFQFSSVHECSDLCHIIYQSHFHNNFCDCAQRWDEQYCGPYPSLFDAPFGNWEMLVAFHLTVLRFHHNCRSSQSFKKGLTLYHKRACQPWVTLLHFILLHSTHMCTHQRYILLMTTKLFDTASSNTPMQPNGFLYTVKFNGLWRF